MFSYHIVAKKSLAEALVQRNEQGINHLYLKEVYEEERQSEAAKAFTTAAPKAL